MGLDGVRAVPMLTHDVNLQCGQDVADDVAKAMQCLLTKSAKLSDMMGKSRDGSCPQEHRDAAIRRGP